jgi:sugar phosphate permease
VRDDACENPLELSDSTDVRSALGIRQFVSLIWIALGTFATGTKSFMIAALLPALAKDLSVTLTAAGQLVTLFAITYAVSSPILSALTAGVGRRNLLLISMTAFALANFSPVQSAAEHGLLRSRRSKANSPSNDQDARFFKSQ